MMRGKKEKRDQAQQQSRALLLQVQMANAKAEAPVLMWTAAVKQERAVNTDGGRNDESKERSWMEGGGSLRGECRHGCPMSSRQWKPLPPSSHPHLFFIPSHHMLHAFLPLDYINPKLTAG